MIKKKVLICGASGFIGRNLYERLSGRPDLEVFGTYNTINPFPKDKHIFRADFTTKKDAFNLLKGIDILIMAAATTSGAKDIINKPYYHVTDNALMNTLLLQGAYDNNVSQVIFFSCTVMYPANNKSPVKETGFDPVGETYEKKYFGALWTKVFIEKLCQFYSRLGKTKFTVIRHSNVYGPHDKYDLEKSHVFGATVTKVMTAANGKITVWGDGREERDLLYVSDLVDFVELVLRRQNYNFDIFNVGLGKSVSVKELVKKIVTASDKKLRISYDKTKPTIPTKLTLDISKVKKRFGWSPKTSLDEGIKKTLQWYKKNIS